MGLNNLMSRIKGLRKPHTRLPSYERNVGKVSYTYKDVGSYGKFINSCRIAAWERAISSFSLPRERILDVGCSYGSWLDNWKQFGFQRLAGAEPNPEAYEVAKTLYDEVRCIYSHELSKYFSDEPVAAANGVLVHILEPRETVQFLRDVAGTLANDGYFLYSVISADFYYSTDRRPNVGDNWCVQTLGTHRDYARQAGLEIRAEIGTFIDPWALPQLEFLAQWKDDRETAEFYKPFVGLGDLLRGRSLVPFSEVLLVTQRKG